MSALKTIAAKKWDHPFSNDEQQTALNLLEEGYILFLPNLPFQLTQDEQPFLSADCACPHAKNISYQAACNKLWGVQHLTDAEHLQLKAMLNRYSQQATTLLAALLPHYAEHATMARTSFRPVEVGNRRTSYRKDDKRLHVDAFPSAPNQGKRILRVFSNINPDGKDRVWRVGEPFARVAEQFLPGIKKPVPGFAHLLRFLKITKSYRTPYDHYMLHLHDKMKADTHYQQHAAQQTVHFPPGSTWIVQTDHVSHAAMFGQHVLEQTFYLPITAMQNEVEAPLRILERLLQQPLV